MATTEIGPKELASRLDRKQVVNDFSLQVATVNGSGSQSANTVLLRTIFQMGVPVSGKNLFPSNIAGLPTWYTIRASKDGYSWLPLKSVPRKFPARRNASKASTTSRSR